MNHKYFWLRVVTLIGIVLNLLGPMAVMPVYAETIIFTGEELLGRPTDTSITINIVPDTTIEYYYEYGTSSGSYTGQTSPVTATGGQPHEVTITGLDPDTRYYYRMIYDGDGDVEDGDYETRTEHTFHTQRAEGESFVFTVTSDSHGNFSANTATNILNNGPDFHVDLGDTFMVDNVSPTSQSAYNARYEQWRGTSYFGGIGQSVSIYLTPGNHEEEEGWNLDDTPSRALFNIEARKLYFPMPNDDGFYSASTDTLADLSGDQLRENYYAWEWGDALFVVIDEFQYTMELPYAPGAAGEGTDDPQTGDQWSWTLGEIQYNWLKQTLTSSDAKYKFVFSHNMLGGIPNLTVAGVGPGYVRGGAKGAPYFEWGGYNGDDSWGFDTERPGWDKPIHQLFIENGVSAYFHGHDHQYVYETRDGVVYQEVPSAGNMTGFSDIYTEGDYTDFYGDYSTVEILPSAGHLRISVTPAEATVDYIAASGGGVNYSYTIAPNQTADPDYFITATAGANGSISPSGLVGVVAGNDQSFTITPDPSYQVADVLVDGGSVGAVTEYTFYDVTADHTIAASFVAAPPTGEVTVDGTASSATGDEVAVLSFAHTTGSGENRLLLVGIAWNSGSTERDITSVVFNDGTTDHPLSVVIDEQATSTTAPRNAAIYSLLNPPAGASGTVTVTFSGDVSNGIVAGAVNFAGVNQTIPLGTPNGGTASSSAAPTVTLNGLNGDELVFDTVFQGASNETQTLTPGVDQTEQWNAWIANVRAAASVKQATSGSVTMSWTAASSAVWVIAAVPINPAPAGTTYELTMASDGNGTTSPTMGVHTYAENAVVSLSATPNTGYVFDSWTGDADCADGSVTMNADKTCAATFVAAPPTGEVTLDGAVSSATGDDVSSLSFAHTTGTGSNRLLLVGVSWNCGSNNRTISSVTFTPDGGSAIALAQVITQLGYNTSNPRYSAIYSLLAPPSGQAGTVTITFSGSVSNGIMAGAANFAGVDQSTPLGTPASANDNSTTPSVELTGLNGDELVFDHVFLGASSSSYELTVGSDQTQLWNPAYVANLRAAASTEQATSGSVTMSWTASTGNYWAIAAVPINPAPTTPICYALVLSHTGQGTDPVASPANSTGCPAGEYVEGESISLSDAEPDIDWQISSWTGTANDSSTADTNSLTMPASAHTASVNYTIIPIVPICVTSRIGASSDDAEERNDTGAVDLDGDTSTHSLQMYRAYGGGSTGTLNWWGLRFLNVNVPQGAIITSATVTFRANNDSDATDSGMTLWGQLAANPGTFTDDDDNITDRTRTTTTAAWSVPQWTSGSDYATPSLTAIVQELVDQPGWVANNAMVIIGQTTESQNRSAISYNSTDGETLAPLIEVCYQMPTGPTIYTSGTLNAFSTTPGTPSDAQTYTVSGNNLSEDILITAPAGFELSVDDINYSNNLILAHAGGSVSTTTVYVRLTGADEGTFSGNIVHTSNAATQVDIAVSGEVAIAPTVTTFQQGIDGYAGTVDTYLESGDADADNSTATTLVVDLDPEQHILLRFDSIFGNDPGQIPPGAIIQSALLEINVTNASDEGALLHRMLQPWNDTDTWNTWGGGIDADGIEARTTADSSSSGSSTGTATIDVTTDVQVWSNNPSSSFGWAWLPPSGDDSWQFRSAEGSTPPKLTVTYFPSSTEPPAAPTDLSATAVSSTRIDLGWTDNSDDETGFEVWSAASDGTPNGLLETVGGNTATYSNTGLDPNTEYCYVVRAINGAGESAYTGVACATTQAAPTTVTIQVRVNQSSDDAEENLSDNSVTIDSSDLEMIHESQIDDYDQEVGMRFQNVQVPAGATIVSAHIVFVADASSGGDGASALTIYGEAADNPAPFEETDENITGRTKTTASMAWNPGTWASGQTYQTSDLTTIVQEIIARGGWISGNAMVFIVTGAPDDQVRAESHDGSSAAAPLLVIRVVPF